MTEDQPFARFVDQRGCGGIGLGRVGFGRGNHDADPYAHCDPLQARYAWHLRKPLDQAAIDAALTWIPGEKDWSGFAGSKCTVVSKVRDVTDATFDRDGDRGFFHFRANGFLTYMVRNLVGTLVYVGLGRLEPEVVAQMIETQDRALGGPGAPGYGLHLWSVEYGTSLR